MRQKKLNNALNDNQLPARLSKKQPVIFLDYDGTLTPIVNRPEDAVMSESMRSVVKELATRCKVAIVSGRDKKDVQNLVGLQELIYAGSHGFDISGPGGMEMQNKQGKKMLPVLEQAEKALEKLSEIEGSQVERKRFSIAIHYRNAAEDVVPEIERVVDSVHKEHPELRKNPGKKIIELQPDIEWDKGKAVLWLMDNLDINSDKVLPIYIGDDLTDEHAFDALRDTGIGILVDDHGHETKAQYALKDTGEVEEFLKQIIKTEKNKNQ